VFKPITQAREEFSVSLRKKKKDEKIMTKRKSRTFQIQSEVWGLEKTISVLLKAREDNENQKLVANAFEQLAVLLQDSEQP